MFAREASHVPRRFLDQNANAALVAEIIAGELLRSKKKEEKKTAFNTGADVKKEKEKKTETCDPSRSSCCFVAFARRALRAAIEKRRQTNVSKKFFQQREFVWVSLFRV